MFFDKLDLEHYYEVQRHAFTQFQTGDFFRAHIKLDGQIQTSYTTWKYVMSVLTPNWIDHRRRFCLGFWLLLKSGDEKLAV